MSRVKAMPDDVKKNCISLVQGYERRCKEYNIRRAELMNNSSGNIVTIRDRENPDDESKHVGVLMPGSHQASRTTEDIVERIQSLESLPDTQRMRAVEYAMKNVRRDICEEMRTKFINAIVLNCKSGKKHPFKVLDIDGFSERGFYRERDRFLMDIAFYLDLM